MAENPKQSMKEDLYEMLLLTKAILTSFWFWLPVIFAAYMYFQLYLMCIHPLLLLIGPAVITIYALLWEEKRVKAKYGIKDVRVLRASEPMFSLPRPLTRKENIESLVEEYKALLEQAEKQKKKDDTK